MQTWNRLLSADEARRVFAEVWEPRLESEAVETPRALGRVLAADVTSPEDLPPFRRSLMDGFACRASDIQAVPARLRLVDDVQMGALPAVAVGPGEAARVPTGGMLPEGAEVVGPVEQAQASGDSVEILATLAAGRHLIEKGEDVAAGALLLPRGHRLRPPDIGALMGLGLATVSVLRRPRVAILSTGDEVVPATQTPPFGKIRDLNSYALAAYVEQLGGVPHRCGIIPDDADALFAAAGQALAQNDVLLFNGGTSVGAKDHVAEVIDRLGRPGVLVHGVDIRPGKPTVFAVCDGKPVFGLPGQPVSALNTFDLFVAPVLRRLLGLPEDVPTLRALLAEPVRSADGREDHVRVILERGGDGWLAHPITGVSAMITTMTRAHGIVVIPARAPGFGAGDEVEVRLIS
jgi:molybdopterin molybdotransferase